MKLFHKGKGKLPVNDERPETIWTDTISTPLGQMIVCATHKGIRLLEFIKSDSLIPDPLLLGKKLHGDVIQGENNRIIQVKQELDDYFSGIRVKFDVPLYPFGTEFQLNVWQVLQQIPFGTTTTYMKQAISVGNQKAVRAVAAANGQNRIAIIIPCHRVIGTNGKLTGYAGGVERKKWLLEFEKRILGSHNSLLFDDTEWNNLNII